MFSFSRPLYLGKYLHIRTLNATRPQFSSFLALTDYSKCLKKSPKSGKMKKNSEWLKSLSNCSQNSQKRFEYKYETSLVKEGLNIWNCAALFSENIDN